MRDTDGCTLYILRCSDGSYYVGTTRKLLDERISEHEQAVFADCYTASRRPVSLAYACHFQSITDAIACERQLKGWSRAKKEAVIEGRFELLPRLAQRPSARRRKPKPDAI